MKAPAPPSLRLQATLCPPPGPAVWLPATPVSVARPVWRVALGTSRHRPWGADTRAAQCRAPSHCPPVHGQLSAEGVVCPRPPEGTGAGAAGGSRVAEPTQRTTRTQKPKLLAFRDVCGPELAPGRHTDLAEAPSLGGPPPVPQHASIWPAGSCHSRLWGLCPRKAGGRDQSFATLRDPVACHSQILPSR